MMSPNLNKKGAFSLTVSYLVSILLMLVMIGLALTFFYRGIAGSNQGLDYIDDTQKSILDSELKLGTAKVSIPLNRATIYSGGSHSFALGIKNNLGKSADFGIQILFNSATDLAGKEILVRNVEDWYLSKRIELTLNPQEVHLISLPFVTPGAESGVYRFDVMVEYLKDGEYVNYAQKSLFLEIE
jgi:hypothetical protein